MTIDSDAGPFRCIRRDDASSRSFPSPPDIPSLRSRSLSTTIFLGRKRKDERGEKEDGGSHKKHVKESWLRPERRAAQNINYDERIEDAIDQEDSNDTVTQAVYSECGSEREAVLQTGSVTDNTRRLPVDVDALR